MLKKVLLSTVLISGAIFGSFLVLLATKGSTRVEIQVENQDVFYGELKDVVSPGVGAVFSLGLGIASTVVIGWRQSIHQASELEKKSSHLQNLLKEKDAQIEALKLSPSGTALSQLTWFLENQDGETQDNEYVTHLTSNQPTTEPTKIQTATVVTEPLVITNSGFESQPITTDQLSVRTATSKLPSAQSVMGFAHKHNSPRDIDA